MSKIQSFHGLLPTEIYFGRGCVTEHSERLALGKRAFIVAGNTSAEKSGAIFDCVAALNKHGIAYMISEAISNNPTVEECKEAGKAAHDFDADFIIGIGGGSPLDASKAVAVFAANDISTERIFTYGYDCSVLPIAAIPTTSGTGSEVTPWSVMTRHDLQTKRSFGGLETYPTVAMLDPRYTESMPETVTRNTAMDAFSHCFESIISNKATPITDALNLYALKQFSECLAPLEEGGFAEIRDTLMLVSMLGGITISQTGTTIMHAMGYPLTYFFDTPHGLANMHVLPVYLDAVVPHKLARLQLALSAMDIGFDSLYDYAMRNFPFTNKLTQEQITLFSEQTAKQGSSASTGIPHEVSDIEKLYVALSDIGENNGYHR